MSSENIVTALILIILGGCIIFAGSEHKDEVLYKDGQRSVSTKNNNIIFPNDSVLLQFS